MTISAPFPDDVAVDSDWVRALVCALIVSALGIPRKSHCQRHRMATHLFDAGALPLSKTAVILDNCRSSCPYGTLILMVILFCKCPRYQKPNLIVCQDTAISDFWDLPQTIDFGKHKQRSPIATKLSKDLVYLTSTDRILQSEVPLLLRYQTQFSFLCCSNLVCKSQGSSEMRFFESEDLHLSQRNFARLQFIQRTRSRPSLVV